MTTLDIGNLVTAAQDGAGPTAVLLSDEGEARFELGAELGRGGMGRVVEARDRQFNRVVAVKELLAPSDDPAIKARFVTESLVTGNLEHPGIPSVYARGERDGAPYYAMRLIRGRTLSDVLREAHTLEERMGLVPVLLKVAQTVAYAHERGVIHRDLKPANILLGAHGEVVLLDWGIAKVRGVASDVISIERRDKDAAQTSHGSILGTPAYMAPEQAAGFVDRIDERTDVFALGAMLYQLLSGRPPYDRSNASEAIADALEARPPALKTIAPKAPTALCTICEKAMAKDQQARYDSARDFQQAIERYTARALAQADEPRSLRWSLNTVLLATMIFVFASLGIVVWRMPTFREQGSVSIGVFLLAGAGFLLSLVEGWTRGRHRLQTLIIAFAVGTMLVALSNALLGVGQALYSVGELADRDAAFKRVLTRGLFESLGGIGPAATLTAVQIFAWAIARRRSTN